MKKVKPLIAITMGDAAGIGPEIICKMFMRKSYRSFCDIVVVGHKPAFDKTIQYYRYYLRTTVLKSPEDAYLLPEKELGIIEINEKENFLNFRLGTPVKELGKIALSSIDKATDFAVQNKIDALVTAPINKELIGSIHKNFIGHTEYIANKVKSKTFNMMLASNKMKVVLVTTHLSIKDIPKNITKKKIIDTVTNTQVNLQRLGYKKPRIAVLGLNPHCGDGGLFGKEEIKTIIPAIEHLNEKGITCEGPFSADSFFYRYERYPIFDAIVAMYHDQGLIPLKMESFSKGINATIGLPIIRTSVDHGTGYDIAGKNMANDRSLFEAVKFAYNLSRREYGR